MKVVCIKCGADKNAPWQECPQCGLEPVDEDLVKSVYLSSGRFALDPERAAEYESELADFQAAIRGGRTIEYEEPDLQRLREEKEFVETWPEVATWSTLFRFLLPGIIFLIFLWLLNFLLGLYLRKLH